jgi:protease YdgD
MFTMILGWARAGAHGLTAACFAAGLGLLWSQSLVAMQLQSRTHAATGGALQRVAVFGTDDRIALPAKYKDVQQKIGLLFNMRSRTVCTAFCVAPDVVATAGHCLHRTLGERAPQLADFWFARNYDATRDYARISGHANGTAAQQVMSGSMSLNVRPPIDATKDWAMVRLSRPICAKGVLPIRALPLEQIMAHASANRVFQISYHRDFTPWRLAYSRPCGVAKSFETADWGTIAQDFSDSSHLLLHTCDTGGASSGSPLLLDTANGPEVIGINVGTYVQSKVVMQDGKVTQRLKADTVANTGVSAAVFADKLALFREAAILTEPAQVRELQTALRGPQALFGSDRRHVPGACARRSRRFETIHALPVHRPLATPSGPVPSKAGAIRWWLRGPERRGRPAGGAPRGKFLGRTLRYPFIGPGAGLGVGACASFSLGASGERNGPFTLQQRAGSRRTVGGFWPVSRPRRFWGLDSVSRGGGGKKKKRAGFYFCFSLYATKRPTLFMLVRAGGIGQAARGTRR